MKSRRRPISSEEWLAHPRELEVVAALVLDHATKYGLKRDKAFVHRLGRQSVEGVGPCANQTVHCE